MWQLGYKKLNRKKLVEGHSAISRRKTKKKKKKDTES